MTLLFSWMFWSDAFTRAFRTFCQTLAAVLGGSALNIWTAGWHSAIGVAAGSALLSFLMAADRLSGGTRVEVIESAPQPAEPAAPLVGFVTPIEKGGGGCGECLR